MQYNKDTFKRTISHVRTDVSKLNININKDHFLMLFNNLNDSLASD